MSVETPSVTVICAKETERETSASEMVVLQESGSPIQAPAALLDPLDYRQTPTCLKMLPKRYISVHQWLGPVCPKELKAQLVSFKLLHSEGE